MEYLRIGKFVSTHGLKGEIKILSNLNDIDKIIKVDTTIYIGNDKLPFIVKTHRKHQKYNMVTLNNIFTIEDVLPYKGLDIYMNKENIKIDLFEDIIGYDVYNNDIYIGKVIELLKGVKYNLLVIGDNRIIIPYLDNFVKLIDKDNKLIKTNYML
jgi:16S rRNA processing protein RimM